MRITLHSFLLLLGMITLHRAAYAKVGFDSAYLDAARRGAMTRIDLRVVDDDGTPIRDANVSVLMGMIDADKNYWIKGCTDTNGVFMIEGKTCGNEIAIDISKHGYYDSTRKLCYVDMACRRSVKDGAWQPWGEVVTVVLRRIVNPIRIVKCSTIYEIPMTNVWLGFDLAQKDWIAPYGRGRFSDLEFLFSWDGLPPMKSKFLRADVRFQAPGGGCYSAAKTMDSKFKGVYNAIANAWYDPKGLVFETDSRSGVALVKKFDFKNVLVVRSRCVVDEQGCVCCSNYSSIYALLISGGWNGRCEMTLRYYFNPTPNDTNLEPIR